MNDTLLTVLITIAAVQTVNFILLVLDEEFGWKYETWVKRICCLVPWLIITLFLSPRLIYMAVKRRRRPKYFLYKTQIGENPKGRKYVNRFNTYPDAYDFMEEDVMYLFEEKGSTFTLDSDDRNGTYIFKDGNGTFVKYEIIKR